MSNVTAPGDPELRIAIKNAVQRHASITVAETVTEVADGCGCPETAVIEALDQMERNGFVYVVGDGSDAEVRVP